MTRAGAPALGRQSRANMDLSPNTLDFLHGRRFSAARGFALDRRTHGERRSERLAELLHGLRLLHVGCCDQLPLLRDKLSAGTFLHAILCRVATQCVGVDARADGLQLLRDLGFADTFLPDQVPQEPQDPPFDVCLVANALEYQANPAAFLAGLRRYRFRHLLVVVPNGLSWRHALPLREVVNTEQRLSFTPYTLCKVLVDAGYEPERVELTHGDFATWKGALAARLADHVVLTSDNPRDEAPGYILSQILAGITGHDDVDVIEDRREAIARAVNGAAKGDVIVLAGKGHEDYQEVAGVRHPFSDPAVAADAPVIADFNR